MEEAVADCVAALGAVTDRDWTEIRAGRLEWSCRRTAAHIASDLIAYAGQLAGRTQDAYTPFMITIDGAEDGLDPADNAGTLQVITATGALLAAAVRTTPRAVRAFHPFPFRHANREGFAAMGVAEVLLHTYDIAEGMKIGYEPPAELVSFVLTRIFPQVKPGPTPWRTLLWATGRGDLPGREPVTAWRWCNNPVLSSERLALEGVTPAAAADLSLAGDGGFAWVGGAAADGTREGAGIMVKQYEEGVFHPEWGMYALVRREDDLAVGAMGFHGVPDGDGRVEIGYDLVVGARGHGYATEALRTLSRWALEQDGVRTVAAVVDHENVPSQNVVTRAGFTRVAEDVGQISYELRR
ncbi:MULTISPECIES: GNAT family N-acetyltransferase [unclassified Streptomyces]|uniref:GNAT family N-acetyltransferase n=1 Tax=unclassified Streptomyces TaxID=2593676 RepID=UPI000F6BA1E5|nr:MULTISPECIES: GNAT family N-acetyltransferase [unclassified Streptomyces]AZM61564.1 GNAT family N-acetyltransferase [Streptomyces sp. WAC 01438]RSN01385.1 GNAT family N-acetyltransferase [Streptomyces sp. WAC 01420]